MAGERAGERTIRFLVDRGRLESLGGTDLAEAAGIAQYFDPAAPPVEPDDAEWAIGISNDAVEATRNLLDTDPPGRFGG